MVGSITITGLAESISEAHRTEVEPPPLWEHQKEAIERVKGRAYYALFFDVGTGKTRAMIEILRDVYNQHQCILPTLIFAPLTICHQWREQIGQFSKIPLPNVKILVGPGVKREKMLSTVGNDIVITNYETVQMGKVYEYIFREWKPRVIVWDESQKLKDPTTSRYKKMVPLADISAYRFLMSGTPIANSLMDVFGQFRCLDLGKRFGKNFYAFRKIFFQDKNAGMPRGRYFPKWVVKDEYLEFFSKAIAEVASQADKSECLDLPPLLKVEVPVTLQGEQLRVYEQMRKNFVAELDGCMTVAEFAMTKVLRLRQIISGYILNDENDEVKFVKENAKLSALSDTLEQIGLDSVIIWTNFRATYKQIFKLCEQLGRKPCMLTGDQLLDEKNDSINGFTSGVYDTIIANLAAGGPGVNLQKAKYAIYYSHSYSLLEYTQSEGRNYRGGSDIHDKVVHYHIIAKGTIDEVVIAALMRKQSVADAILNWAKEKYIFNKNNYCHSENDVPCSLA